MSSRDFWPIFLLIAAFIFLIDVFIRRVTVHFYWVCRHWPMPTAASAAFSPKRRHERLARLRNRKAAIANQIDERRAAARFEPVLEDAGPAPRDTAEILSDASGGSTSASAAPPRRHAIANTARRRGNLYRAAAEGEKASERAVGNGDARLS